MNKLSIIIALLISGTASANKIIFPDDKPIIFPDDSTSTQSSDNNQTNHPSNVSKPLLINPRPHSLDDINNQIGKIFLSQHHKETAAVAKELEQIGTTEGFTVELTNDGELWAEDNKWMSADGTHIYQPVKALEGGDKDDLAAFTTALPSDSPGYIREGHHSFGWKEMFGVRSENLRRAKVLADKIGAKIEKAYSVIDGGNMLIGKKANGETYAIVGRDSVLATTVLHNELTPERIDAKKGELKARNRLYFAPFDSPPLGTIYGPDINVDIKLLELTNYLPANADQNTKETTAENYRTRVYFSGSDRDQIKKEAQKVKLSSTQMDTLVSLFAQTHHNNFNFDLNNPSERKEAEEEVKMELAKVKVVMSKKPLYSEEQVQQQMATMHFDGVEVDQTITQLETGSYLDKNKDVFYKETAAKKFLAMNELTKNIMAKELGVKRNNLVIIAQPGFHVDMHLRPLRTGEVMIHDPEITLRLVNITIRNTPETDPYYPELQEAKKNVEKEKNTLQPLYDKIAQQLSTAGLQVNKAPGVFQTGKREVNFMNGITGSGASGAFYITNASSIKLFNEAFAYFMQGQGITKTYFIGQDNAKDISRFGKKGENVAELLLRRQGGLDCITTHIAK
ncbi:hypothetical protein [Spartinivicinus poritis]|uniref:Uncharacterized protein n=1 Tax=Spartinivicinus poritis TaxID=2994640 RepID=A0ABT5U6Y3_9GAMM|nr:hypothetical protein [Spartinivicinus sp. A2-2]MDE1461307.1 hypothetical protein [Spartinivicinus sp. A2-2]